jgi:hypothetical protein
MRLFQGKPSRPASPEDRPERGTFFSFFRNEIFFLVAFALVIGGGVCIGMHQTRAEQREKCIQLLGGFRSAKEYLAQKHDLKPGDSVNEDEVPSMLINDKNDGRGIAGHFACPAGGAYTLNPVGSNPVCSVRGHVLPR